jgi:hypothetical protein
MSKKKDFTVYLKLSESTTLPGLAELIFFHPEDGGGMFLRNVG